MAISHWDTPGEIIASAASSFRLDKWADQDYYVEIWIEKDALAGILQQAADGLDVPYFSCRGYVSASEMWSTAQRLKEHSEAGRDPVIIHLGDHDPSGIDMSRDIEARLNLFGAFPIFKRIALNWDQIQQYCPPPNPTKLSDTRATDYIDKYGQECWELDALEPRVIAELVQDAVGEYLDDDRWQARYDQEVSDRLGLTAAASRWDTVQEFLEQSA
jgi:hypothetical protein